MPAKSTFLTVITTLILIVLPNLLHLTPAAGAIVQDEPEPTALAGFRLISATDGWLRLGQHLYWTRDSGHSWTEITPANLDSAIIQAAWLVDTQHGWLALTGLDASGSIAYRLVRTSDGGATWQVTHSPCLRRAARTPWPKRFTFTSLTLRPAGWWSSEQLQPGRPVQNHRWRPELDQTGSPQRRTGLFCHP